MDGDSEVPQGHSCHLEKTKTLFNVPSLHLCSCFFVACFLVGFFVFFFFVYVIIKILFTKTNYNIVGHFHK